VARVATLQGKGCVKCHSPVHEGGVAVGPFLPERIGLLPPIGIAQAMWNHGPQMAVKMAALGMERPLFEPGEMADVIAYLRGGAASNVPWTEFPGNPATGRALYESRGCAHCHSPQPEGKSLGPDLSRATWYRTSTEMAAVMWNHEPAMRKTMQATGVAVPHFEERRWRTYSHISTCCAARNGSVTRSAAVVFIEGAARPVTRKVDLSTCARRGSDVARAPRLGDVEPCARDDEAVAQKGMGGPRSQVPTSRMCSRFCSHQGGDRPGRALIGRRRPLRSRPTPLLRKRRSPSKQRHQDSCETSKILEVLGGSESVGGFFPSIGNGVGESRGFPVARKMLKHLG
jgi:cytochrome c2